MKPRLFPQPLYAIVDAGVLAARDVSLAEYAAGLRAAGVALVQYRDKDGSPQDLLHGAARLKAAFAGSGCSLIMNDRADLAVLADYDGVHVGHLDLSPADAKRVVGDSRMVGVSTHNEEQVRAAELSCADYVAFGPIFSTGTKVDTEPVVGLEGLRRARTLTSKPLVAIGGITRQNARDVIEAGADSLAVISGLLVPGEPTVNVARDFLELLR